MLNNQKDDKEELIEFFDNVEKILRDIVKEIRKFAPNRDEEFYSLIEEVWNDEIKPKFNKAREEIKEIDTVKLEKVGLTGKQLKLKLMQFNYRYNQYYNEYEEFLTFCKEYREFLKFPNIFKKVKDLIEKLKKLKKKLKKLLNIINKILESLRSIVGPVEMIKEFKDIIDDSIQDN